MATAGNADRFGNVNKLQNLNIADRAGCVQRYGLAEFKSCPSLLSTSPVRLKGHRSPRKSVAGLPAYLSVRDELGKNALIYAVFGNSAKCLKSLLKFGIGVNEVDFVGRSALHWAAIKNLVDCTKLLLSSGAKCDLQDFEGATPLHLASVHDSSKVLQLILKHVSTESVMIQDIDKRTALHWCACAAYAENFGLLLKYNKDLVTMRDVAGKTALHWLARSSKMSAVDCIRLFFAQDFGPGVVNVCDYEGRTALHCAVIDGIFPVVKELISLPTCIVNVKDNLESTPLHWATILGKLKIVNFLLDHGASVDVHDIDEVTPLHYAVQNDCQEMLSAYMLRSTVPDQRDQNGCTPLMWAASKAADKAIVLLSQFGADIHASDNNDFTALHVAAFSGRSSTLDTLLNLGASASDVDAQGKTALFLACEMGHLDAAITLLHRGGSDVNHIVDKCGRTCLHWAASNGHINTCQLLIQNGCDTNAGDSLGRSPILYATFHGYIDCMSFLKENGANPEYCDNQGWTALHYACKQGHYDAVKLLLDWNVSPNPKVYFGERFTPLDLATICVHWDVSKFLCKKGGVSITSIRQAAAITIQTAYRGYRSRKLYKLRTKPLNVKSEWRFNNVKESESHLSSATLQDCPMIRKNQQVENLHRPLEKRLSRSVENLLPDSIDKTNHLLLATNYHQSGLFRLRRKKFNNLARSELALKCEATAASPPAGEVQVNCRPRLKSVDGMSSNIANVKASSPSPAIPAWCFDPVRRRAAEKDWLESLANIAFKRVPMKCEKHIPR